MDMMGLLVSPMLTVMEVFHLALTNCFIIFNTIDVVLEPPPHLQRLMTPAEFADARALSRDMIKYSAAGALEGAVIPLLLTPGTGAMRRAIACRALASTAASLCCYVALFPIFLAARGVRRAAAAVVRAVVSAAVLSPLSASPDI